MGCSVTLAAAEEECCSILITQWPCDQARLRAEHYLEAASSIAFIDLKDIWYTRPRPSLEYSTKIWLLSNFFCYTTTIPYRHVCSSVIAGSQFSSFPVEVEVKQGCVLVPIIFLSLVAIILRLTVTSKHLIVSKFSIVLMVVSSICDVYWPKLRLSQHWFLPFSTPMMQPFPTLRLTDFNVVLMLSQRHTSMPALWSIQRWKNSLVHSHLMLQRFPFAGSSIKLWKFNLLGLNTLVFLWPDKWNLRTH